jgi:tetratricopeptide (TPR) repeat protein
MNIKLLLSFALCFFAITSFAQKKDIKMAQSHLANKDYAKAETSINAAINTSKGKTDKTAWVIRGDVYSALASSKSDLTSAKTAYESYVSAEDLGKSGDCKNQLKDLGKTCLAAGYIEERGKSYSASMEWYSLGEQVMSKADPSDAQFNARLAHCYFMTEKYDEAIKHHRRCIENNYHVMEAYVGIDYCYGMSYDYTSEMRVANMEEALTKLPDNERILSVASEAYVADRNFEKAEEVLEKMIKLYPESPNSYFAHGNAMTDAYRYTTENGDGVKAMDYYAKAEKSYLKADELLPNNNSISYSLGTLYYTRALDFQRVMNELGFSKEELKKHEELSENNKKYLKKSLPYLEQAYFKGSRDDLTLMNALQNIYLTLDMSEEYKLLMGK